MVTWTTQSPLTKVAPFAQAGWLAVAVAAGALYAAGGAVLASAAEETAPSTAIPANGPSAVPVMSVAQGDRRPMVVRDRPNKVDS